MLVSQASEAGVLRGPWKVFIGTVTLQDQRDSSKYVVVSIFTITIEIMINISQFTCLKKLFQKMKKLNIL